MVLFRYFIFLVFLYSQSLRRTFLRLLINPYLTSKLQLNGITCLHILIALQALSKFSDSRYVCVVWSVARYAIPYTCTCLIYECPSLSSTVHLVTILCLLSCCLVFCYHYVFDTAKILIQKSLVKSCFSF